MAALLNLLQQQIDNDTIDRLSSVVGADRASTQKAVTAALPLLIGALSRNTRQGGAQSLDRALARDHDGTLLDNLSSLLGSASGGGGGLLSTLGGLAGSGLLGPKAVDGEGILGHLLGGKRRPVEAGVSKASGLDAAKVAKLLALLAPLVMSALGKVKRERNLNADGLTSLLDDERSTIEKETPAASPGGLFSLLDADDDGSIADDVARLGASLAGSGGLGSLFGKKK